MREIKFRAWLPAIKKMTYAHTLEELMNWNTDPKDNGTAVWLQYTGLKDCKRTAEYPDGQPIYEGDILQINIMDWNRPGNIIASGNAAVEYRGCTFGVEWGFSLEFSGLDEFSNNCTLEVIGNVFDNPDLLGGSET